MANLSQQRRQRMLDFLQKVRDKNKDDDEALVAIGEIENELTEKKYGLVWEEHSEEVEEQMLNNVPVFIEDKDKEITMTENGYNFLLEGDNLHSLHLLEKTHKEKIDVIYIDPPYNTGNEDFIYDDEKIGKDDSFRHSMWLSFMERRLSIAKKLLKNDGVIFISIDDNEQPQLKMLCDSIFGEQNFVETFIWEKNPNPTFLNKYSRSSAEYILCYAKDKLNGLLMLDGGIIGSTETDAPLQNKGNPKRIIRIKAGMAKALFPDQHIKEGNYGLVDVIGDVDFVDGYNANDFAIEGTFRMTEETLYERIDNGEVLLFKTPRMSPRLSYKANETHSAPLKTLWSDKYGTTQIGNNDLKKIFGDLPFSYPKPAQLIRNLISFKDNKNSLILDFFAGSGTTGQAVLELNKEDGGNRKFILCTNNENNICESVTYPRLQTVITGMRQDGNKYSDGIPADLKYYHTDYVAKDSPTLVEDLLSHIDEMIQLEYGVKIDKEKYISVLSDEDADELEANWNSYPNIRAIYISRKVLLTAAQRDLFKTRDCFTVPDYYFRDELKEAGDV